MGGGGGLRGEEKSSKFSTSLCSEESDCYRLFHTGKLWEMFNWVSREHRYIRRSCPGSFDFDYQAEEQRGLCWRETVVCDTCSYRSKPFSLYKEIETGKKGRKAATANVGLNVALTQTSVGAQQCQKNLFGNQYASSFTKWNV